MIGSIFASGGKLTGRAGRSSGRRAASRSRNSPGSRGVWKSRSADGSREMLGALTSHWPEYLMEGAELGVLMVLVCGFATLLEYPASPLHGALTNAAARRAVMAV